MYNGKRVVITYGTYDLLHFGHIALMQRAKELGDFLIVGVTSDAFDRTRGKLNVYQPLNERLEAVKNTGIPDMVIVEEYKGQKIADILKYGVDIFAIGSDWEGKFDYLKRYCDVVYLQRTEGVSSTELRAEKMKDISLGCIGADYLASRYIRESTHVAGLTVTGYAPLANQDNDVCAQGFGIVQHDSVDDMCAEVDAVYITAPINERAGLIEKALRAHCHVMCEGPMFLSVAEGERLYALASENKLVLMEALKTLYFPAFERLKLLLECGVVGEIKDVRASFSHVFAELDKTNPYQGSFYDMASYGLIPATMFLGHDVLDARLICSYEDDFCVWSKCDLLYSQASATMSVGRGIKTEGDMVITGTDGYVYVPAPWWKTDYFEVRGEDPREYQKFYFECVGEGQRYEQIEFLRLIKGHNTGCVPVQSKEDVLAVTRLVEMFDQGDVVCLNQGDYHFGGGEKVVDR